jgi:hypothetical protein
MFRMKCKERLYLNFLYIFRCQTVCCEQFTKISVWSYIDLRYNLQKQVQHFIYGIENKWNILHIYTAFLKNILEITDVIFSVYFCNKHNGIAQILHKFSTLHATQEAFIYMMWKL